MGELRRVAEEERRRVENNFVEPLFELLDEFIHFCRSKQVIAVLQTFTRAEKKEVIEMCGLNIALIHRMLLTEEVVGKAGLAFAVQLFMLRSTSQIAIDDEGFFTAESKRHPEIGANG